ncbi:hypothetical protein HDU67_000848 [Dinochytrium kinnereticum]|nr:hypothetical protein HDU67_000848 [Dinochytrium kinnereticum]
MDSLKKSDDTASIASTSSSRSKVPKEKVKRRIWQYSIIAGATVLLAAVGNNKNSRTASTFGKSTFGKSKTQLASSEPLEDEVRDCFNRNYIYVRVNVTTIDPLGNSFKARVSFLPCGDFVITTGTQGGLPMASQDMNITVARSIMPATEIVVSFASNEVNNYPFDRYESSRLYIMGTYVNPDTSEVERVPMGMTINGALQGWNIHVPTMDDISRDESGESKADGTILVLVVNMRRSGTAKFFSLMVIAIMWTLVLLIVALTISVWWDWRKVEPPVIAFAISLLFALPAVRSAQPGIPPIGCTADVVSFFWAMVLEAFSAAGLLLNYIVMYKRDTKWAPKNA